MVRDGVPGDIRSVPSLRPAPVLPGAPTDRLRGRPAGWLPRGLGLAEPDWWWRHRIVCAVLGAHLPVVLVLAAVRSRGTAYGLLEVALPALLLAAALLPLGRRLRALAAALGLLTCSALLVHLFAGATEAHFHYFVVVALVALYQDWTVYALAIGFVALQHTAVGVLAPGAVQAGDLDPWVWGLLHAGFILAESAVLVLFWHAGEQAHRREQRLLAAIDEGRDSLRARLADTDRMRRDLIGTVSHEFRTPLTGIRGATLTLLKRGERLDAEARRGLLHAVLDQQERLSRLLENMLTAAQATEIDPAAVAEVDAVAAEVAMLAESARPSAGAVQVLVEPGTLARIDRHALHQVLANLIDNAQQHGSPGAVPIVAGGRDSAGVWLTVSNDGSQIAPEVTARLFEPFTQADSGATRHHEGIGMGLYVVRRLVEVHGGRVAVRSDDGWVTVEVRLQAAASPLRATSSA
jgi:signal transduction histidine kinase